MEELNIEEIVQLARLVPIKSWINISRVGDFYAEEYHCQIHETNIAIRREMKADAPFSTQYYVYAIWAQTMLSSHHLGGDNSYSRNYEESKQNPNRILLKTLFDEIIHKRGSPQQNPKEFTRDIAIRDIRSFLFKSSQIK